MSIVEFERRGRIGIITLNRPETRNAFDSQMAKALGAAVDELEADAALRVGILSATVTEPRPVFSSGHDLRTMEDERDGGERAETELGGFAGIVRYPRKKPLVAAVDGLATSGGLEVVLACDLVVATARSSFALAEVKWGLIAGAGGLFRLPWAIGRAPAMDAILTGTPISAERAYQLGLVSTFVNADAVGAAIERAELIAGHAPLGVALSREVAAKAFSLSEQELWAENDRAGWEVMRSPELVEGVAAFTQRRR
ncbi:enoyl-CoA hydratase-related protein [Nocardia vinacea]|uniref:Enoyl-CoA hydratase-related protein n=1 Tax=Nocardia vinacea TaxID=96468 RepID=A0ABZ1YTE8_9NOCA|nr:enoyl-CoA hydratase-related protein [Nocardia vinacea]